MANNETTTVDARTKALATAKAKLAESTERLAQSINNGSELKELGVPLFLVEGWRDVLRALETEV